MKEIDSTSKALWEELRREGFVFRGDPGHGSLPEDKKRVPIIGAVSYLGLMEELANAGVPVFPVSEKQKTERDCCKRHRLALEDMRTLFGGLLFVYKFCPECENRMQ